MFYVQNISIYKNFGGYVGERPYSTVHFLFIIKKKRKMYKSVTYTKIKFHIILFYIFFFRMNNKIFTKGGARAPLPFLYKVSIVVQIDFISILLTLGIFLIQIINTNNTNMYLIYFHSKNSIKMRFAKSMVFKFQTRFSHSLSVAAR